MEDNQKDKLDHSELLRLVYSEDHVDSESDRYIGELTDGKRNGYGILLYANGNRYLGEFEDNHFCGEGIFYFKNGDLFQGVFSQSLLNGLGRYKSKDGYEYYGYWLNGSKNGWGRMRNQTVWTYNSETYKPEIYDGFWKDDLFHGDGLHEHDGIRYYGAWESGIKLGYGKLHDDEYDYRYEGFFSKNEFEGQGVLTFNDKSFYNGKFKEGKPNGYGFYQDVNKVKHYGDWKNGFCSELLNQYIEEFINKYFSKEFEELKILRTEWDSISDEWKNHLNNSNSNDKNQDSFVGKIKKKLLDLDIYLADFDELMEEVIYSKINNYHGDNNKYYCCDFSNLWGDVPDPYEALKESVYYKNREILYGYYSMISEEIDQ